MSRKPTFLHRRSDTGAAHFEPEHIAVLEDFVPQELAEIGAVVPEGSQGGPRAGDPEDLSFRFGGPWSRLLLLRTVVAVHTVVALGLRRPNALLDDGMFKRLVDAVGHIRALHPRGSFDTFRLSAAGADSPTVRRLRERLASATGLRDVTEGGDLLLRFRRASEGEPAQREPAAGPYQLTVRISPRPLSALPWRACNLAGALNATVASAMAQLTSPGSEDVYLNLACGSGTLLIERAALAPASRLVGCDVDAAALSCAAQNVAAAGALNIELHPWDACATPLPDSSLSALVADLPFGQLVGSYQTNERLYPALLAEAARLARPGARFVVITQQVNLFERCLSERGDVWSLERDLRIQLPANAGVLKPRIYVLRRV